MAIRKNKTQKQYTTQERRKAVLAMRLGGATYTELAEHFDVSLHTVHTDVKVSLADIPKDEAAELRAQEAMKYDRLQRAMWTKALDGNLGAVDRVLTIMRQRAKLFGLDAPQQVQVGSTVMDLDAAVRDLLAAAMEPEAEEPVFKGLTPTDE